MNDITKITHVTKTTETGGTVVVLNTGAVIGPEAEAMLQALHSRSIGGIKSHLDVLGKRGAEKFMSTYYVGYGHKSIGDLGSASIFVEGISMLAAKAIQNWPLYSGQESSTRYIDFAEQPFMDPLGTDDSRRILETWRSFYLRGVTELQPLLAARFPREESEDEATYTKAINARAFDIMRSFLPAGATTNLAWHSNLRQFADKILELRHHPLEEVRTVTAGIEEALLEAFPNSFSPKRYEETERYNEQASREVTYFHDPDPAEFEVFNDTVDRTLLAEYQELLSLRPPKTELPKAIAECGTIGFRFLLDFGSFRDIQRHRAVTQRMPLLTTELGFAEWYLEELGMSDALRSDAEKLIKEQKKQVEALNTSPEIAQYYTAMGFNTTNRLVGGLPALVYLAELRATRFVHPTLRKRALQMMDALDERFKESGLVLHRDPDPDRFDIKRGEHDIVDRSSTKT